MSSKCGYPPEQIEGVYQKAKFNFFFNKNPTQIPASRKKLHPLKNPVK
jgi:hypothetical protein